MGGLGGGAPQTLTQSPWEGYLQTRFRRNVSIIGLFHSIFFTFEWVTPQQSKPAAFVCNRYMLLIKKNAQPLRANLVGCVGRRFVAWLRSFLISTFDQSIDNLCTIFQHHPYVNFSITTLTQTVDLILAFVEKHKNGLFARPTVPVPHL